MEKICLDSEVALDFLRGDRAIAEKLQYYASNEQVCIHSLIALELAAAIKKQEVLDNLLHNITILPFDKKAARIAVRVMHDLKERGINPSLSTILTASVCIASNAFLFTKKRSQFDGIKGLRLV